jgi:hypothetical protein
MQNGQRCHLIWDRESSLFEVSDERLFIFQNHDQQRPLSAMKLITWLWQCIFFSGSCNYDIWLSIDTLLTFCYKTNLRGKNNHEWKQLYKNLICIY